MSESESELLYDWRFTANQFVLAPSPLSIMTRDVFFWLNPCDHNPYITSPLTRVWVCRLQLLSASFTLRPTVSQPASLEIKHPPGAYDQIFITVRQLRVCWSGALSLMWEWICNLQLLLALVSAVIFGFHILLSQIRDFPFHCLLRLTGSWWRCSTLPPHKGLLQLMLVLLWICLACIKNASNSSYIVALFCCCWNVFNAPLPNNVPSCFHYSNFQEVLSQYVRPFYMKSYLLFGSVNILRSNNTKVGSNWHMVHITP
jgi:hypothetical protein